MKVSKMNKTFAILGIMLVLSLGFAGSADDIGAGGVQTAVNGAKNFLCNILPIALFIAILFAAVLYGIAQTLPADQKARVMQFAGAAFVAGILGAILYVLGPALLRTIANINVDCPST